MDLPQFRQSAVMGLVTCSPLGDRSGKNKWWSDEDCADSSFGRVRTLTSLSRREKTGALFVSVPPGRYVVKFRFECESVKGYRRFRKQLDPLPYSHVIKAPVGCHKAFPAAGFCAALPMSMVEEALQKQSDETLSDLVARESTGLPGMDSLESIADVKFQQQDAKAAEITNVSIGSSGSSAFHQPQIIQRIVSLVKKKKNDKKLEYWEEKLSGVRDTVSYSDATACRQCQHSQSCLMCQSIAPKTDRPGFYIAHFKKLLRVPWPSTDETNGPAYLYPHKSSCFIPAAPSPFCTLKPANSAGPYVVLVGIISSFHPSRVFRLDYLELCRYHSPSVFDIIRRKPPFPCLAPVTSGIISDLSLELISRILGYLDLKSIWRMHRCSRQWFSLAAASDAHLWRYLLRFRFSWYRDTSNPKELFCRFAKGLRFSATSMAGRWLICSKWSKLYPTETSVYGFIAALHDIRLPVELWGLVDNIPPGEYKVRARVVAENTEWKYCVFVAAFPKTDHERIAQRRGRSWLEKVFSNEDNRVWIHEESIDFRRPRRHTRQLLAQDDDDRSHFPSAHRVIHRDDLFAVVEMRETLKVTELAEVYLGIKDASYVKRADIGLDWFELVPFAPDLEN